MGNTSSSVTSGVKNQVNSGSRALYKLVDMTGGGELVGLMKEAVKTKNFSLVDETILREVPQFLYNEGQGKVVHISEVIAQRHEERTGSKMFKAAAADKQSKFSYSKSSVKMNSKETFDEGSINKEVCWDLDQRGSVGETSLHTCFLIGGSIYMEIAKRLIKHFPKLINDTYLCDEYYGENVLHMAIVHEDPAMVRFLLNHNVNIHQRCCGNFFTADDQKAYRTDSPDHEWVDLCLKTRYGGHNYWGEYPLSFAACVSQEECFRLLIVKGANPNLQDTNGNTVLHICVIHDNPTMFDLAYQQGARLDIKNRQGLTPLTLAAKLSKTMMYQHVLSIEREIIWTYGPVTCSAYPLEGTDSINFLTGSIDRNSVLALAVYGDSETHLDLLEGVLEAVLKKKWETFGRKLLYQSLATFLLYFVIYFVAYILRRTPLSARIVYEDNEDNATLNMLPPSNDSVLDNVTTYQYFDDRCYLNRHDTVSDKVRIAFEVCTVFGATVYIITNIVEVHYTGFRLYLESLLGFPARTLFIISLVLTILMVPFRVACLYDWENIIGVFSTIAMSLNFLFYCRGFKMVGPFVLMVYKILADDMIKFLMIYLVFVMGFAQAFYIIFLGQSLDGDGYSIDPTSSNKTMMGNIYESINRMFVVSLNEFSVFYDQLNKSRHPILGKLMFVMFLLLASIMLINLVIAMMTRTYERISGKEKEWVRQWAAIILKMEQGLTPAKRIKAQIHYSCPIGTDMSKRAIIVHWQQNADEKAQAQEERKNARNEFMEMKRSLYKQRLQNGPSELQEAVVADRLLQYLRNENF